MANLSQNDPFHASSTNRIDVDHLHYEGKMQMPLLGRILQCEFYASTHNDMTIGHSRVDESLDIVLLN